MMTIVISIRFGYKLNMFDFFGIGTCVVGMLIILNPTRITDLFKKSDSKK